MKLDSGLKLEGGNVILVPYRKEHVPKYHEWMGDEEILRLTGSERLTLEQEFDMQISWTEDPDKCTFIILNSGKYLETMDEVQSMIGDTNLFFNDKENPEIAEIEIMIADTSSRRLGFATEALNLMINFGKKYINLKTFMAKIKDGNVSSIKLFEKLGFQYLSKSDVFREVTFVLE